MSTFTRFSNILLCALNVPTNQGTVAVRVSPESSEMAMKMLADVKVGDKILKAGPKSGSANFATVVGLPHGPTKDASFEIKMASKHVRLRHKEEPHLVEATPYHTFIRCQERGKGGAAGATDTDGAALVKAKDIKVGDCLHTFHGDKLVMSVTKVPEEEAAKYDTYTIVTEGGSRDLVRTCVGFFGCALSCSCCCLNDAIFLTPRETCFSSHQRLWWEASWLTPRMLRKLLSYLLIMNVSSFMPPMIEKREALA